MKKGSFWKRHVQKSVNRGRLCLLHNCAQKCWKTVIFCNWDFLASWSKVWKMSFWPFKTRKRTFLDFGVRLAYQGIGFWSFLVLFGGFSCFWVIFRSFFGHFGVIFFTQKSQNLKNDIKKTITRQSYELNEIFVFVKISIKKYSRILWKMMIFDENDEKWWFWSWGRVKSCKVLKWNFIYSRGVKV
jgi:hypothetical protein